MNCLECQDLLQRRLDGETVPGSAALEQHLAGCQSCRHTHAAGALLLEGLKELPPSPPLPGRVHTPCGRQHSARWPRRAGPHARAWVTAGLAAAILLMVWAGNISAAGAHNDVEAPAPAGWSTAPKSKIRPVRLRNRRPRKR